MKLIFSLSQAHQPKLMRASIGATLLLYALSAYFLRPAASNRDLILAALCFILATLAIGFVVYAKNLTFQKSISPEVAPSSRINWLITLLGCLSLAALTESNANLLGIAQLSNLSHLLQMLLLVIGTLLLAWGMGGGGLPHFRANPVILALVGVITLVGLGLRLWKLETAVHQFIDEANFSAVVLYFFRPATNALLKPEIRGFPSLYAYLQFQGVSVFGRDLFGLRFPSVIFGTLTIPAIYFLARTLFDRTTALIAAALLAVFAPHLQFSRLGLNNIADPLFGTLAFAFLAQGFKSHRRLDFALGGACLGFTQYFYEGGRLLYPPLVIAWIAIGFLLWKPRPRPDHLAIAGLTALLVAAPVYLTLYAHDFPLAPRLDLEARWSDEWKQFGEQAAPRPYENSLRDSVLAITTRPEVERYYYGGKQGLIPPFLLPLLFLGIAFVLWRFYTPAFLLVLWLLANIIGASLLRQTLPSARFVVSFPAMVLLMAIGLRYTVNLLIPQENYSSLQNITLALILVPILIYYPFYYFGPHLYTFNDQFRSKWAYDGQDALFRSADFPDGTHIYIISDNAIDAVSASQILQFLNDQLSIQVLSPSALSTATVAAFPTDKDSAFFIEPLDSTSLDLLSRHFNLQSPQNSPFDVQIGRQLVLLYAPS